MKTKPKQNFYFFYTLENCSYQFLYTVRNCQRPEQTKQYKKLKAWIFRGVVKSIGWCDQGHYEKYSSEFVSPNLTYLQIN